MAGLWEAAAHADPAFARRLTTHNVADAAALLARYRRVRSPQPPIATAPREIAVLSRVTAGADLAIVTPLLQRLRRRFPDAAITLYGPRTTVYNRYARWGARGVWTAIFEALAREREDSLIFIDSSIVRAHRAAAGSKRGNWRKVLAAHAAVAQVRFTSP